MKILIAALVATTAIIAPANATVYKFSYNGDANIEWKLPASPTPFQSDARQFTIQGVDIKFNGAPDTADILFYTLSEFGAFDFNSVGGVAAVAYGDQLYTGPNSAPTFKLGTFTTTLGTGGTFGAGTLTISAVSGVPEPTNWAMLIAGFGLVGAVARRRRVEALA